MIILKTIFGIETTEHRYILEMHKYLLHQFFFFFFFLQRLQMENGNDRRMNNKI